MGEAELRRLFEQASQAVKMGASIFEVNELIAKKTNGEFAGLQAVAMALGAEEELVQGGSFSQEGSADEAEQAGARAQRWADVGPLRNFVEGGIQGASFGLADDLLGEGFRERREADRAINPTGAAISEAIGTAIPATAGGAGLARVGGGVVRRAAASTGVGAALSGLLAFGEADAGGREVTMSERIDDAVAGGAAGAVVGATFGLVGPVARGVGRMFRSDRALAKEMARETIEQTGKSLDDVVAQLRRRKLETGDELANFADVDDALNVQARRQAAGGTSELRRSGGPLAGMRARVTEEEVRRGTAAIYEPFNHRTLTDKVLLRQLRNGEEIANATRTIVKGDVAQLSKVTGQEIQGIRNELRNQFAAAKNRGDVPSMTRIKQAQIHLDKQVERVMPGYAKANQDFISLTERVEGAEALINALDAALPKIDPAVPQAGGIYASIYRAVGRPKERDALIRNMVAEALLADGEAGIRQLERLVRDGTIAKMFKGLRAIVGPGVRGSALAAPGGLINPDRFTPIDPNQVASPAGDLGPFRTGG